MTRVDRPHSNATEGGLRLLVSTLAVLLLPPFLAVAIVPLALLLFPVAWLAIPFIVPTLLGDALTGSQTKPQPLARRSARTGIVRTGNAAPANVTTG